MFCGGRTSSKDDCLLVKGLFSDLGMCVEMKENIIDAAGAISGCGPAFVCTGFCKAVYIIINCCFAVKRYLKLKSLSDLLVD